MALNFPTINPVAFTIPQLDVGIVALGPFSIRWYALAYLAGFLVGWRYALRLNRLYGDRALPYNYIDDFLTWTVLGVVMGGRVGYILFYHLDLFLKDPLYLFRVWEGGMSFHGGATGVILALLIFSAVYRVRLFQLADIVCACVPIGLLLGRLANFVNAELYGRVTDSRWGMVFPGTDGQPRHPSQLYEAAGEGLLLFIILGLLMRCAAVRERPGIVSGLFLIGYGLCRFMIEYVREPDAHLGILPLGITMGQTLCLPMFLGGALVLLTSSQYWPRHARPA